MINFIKSVLIFLTITLISCGEKKGVKKDKYQIIRDKRNELKLKNKQQSIILSEKQNAIMGWDTVKQYTYQLQEQFSISTKPISFIGIINDIIKKDSAYRLKLFPAGDHYYKTFIAEVELSSSLLKELNEQLTSNKGSVKGCFIFSVTKVESVSPKLTSDFDPGASNDDDPQLYSLDDASSYITLDFDETLIRLKGKLIAFYIYEQMKTTDD